MVLANPMQDKHLTQRATIMHSGLSVQHRRMHVAQRAPSATDTCIQLCLNRCTTTAWDVCCRNRMARQLLSEKRLYASSKLNHMKCTHIQSLIHTHTCTCTLATRTHTHAYTHAHRHTCTHTHAHTHAHTHTCTHTHTPTHTHTHAYTHTRTHMHTHMRTHTHAHTHAHTHTCTRINMSSSQLTAPGTPMMCSTGCGPS